MRFVCVEKCFFQGRAWVPGESLDLPGKVSAHHCFVTIAKAKEVLEEIAKKDAVEAAKIEGPKNLFDMTKDAAKERALPSDDLDL